MSDSYRDRSFWHSHALRIDLPWVGHRSRRWEPEPLRWLGINGAPATMGIADRTEAITGRKSRLARMMQSMFR